MLVPVQIPQNYQNAAHNQFSFQKKQCCALIHHYLRSLQTLMCKVKQLIIERQMLSDRYMRDTLTPAVFSLLLFPKLAYLVDWLLPGFCKSSNIPSLDGDKEKKRCCKLGCRIHTYVAHLAGELFVLAFTFIVITGDRPKKRASFYDKCGKQLFWLEVFLSIVILLFKTSRSPLLFWRKGRDFIHLNRVKRALFF